MPDEWKRDQTYETYVMIHQEVAKLLGVQHIHTRKHFQDFILEQQKKGKNPRELHKVHDWDEFDKLEGGILTFDGQHTHSFGTRILVDLFADHLQHAEYLWGHSDSIEVEAKGMEDEKRGRKSTTSSSGGKSYGADKVEKIAKVNDIIMSNKELVNLLIYDVLTE